MSLIEILVVLAVVGVLFAIAAPTINNQIALQDMRNAIHEVVDVLRDARSSAVDEGVPRYVVFLPPRGYEVRRYDGTTWVAESSQPQQLPRTIQFDDGDVTFSNAVVIDEPEAGAPPIPDNAAYFDTRGAYPISAGVPASYSLTLRGGVGRVETITVHTSTGQVTGL